MAKAIVKPDKGAKCKLVPINLHNQDEFDEMLRQRIACNWDKDPDLIRSWRDAADNKTKSMFWILPPDEPPRLGHISMQSEADPPDPELARPDKTVMMISTFFIYPAYRGAGLGRAAVEALEAYAKIAPYGSPGCRRITLNTISRRYTEEDGHEWRGYYARRGVAAPERGTSNEDWYVRMGYVKWKEEPRYDDELLDGTKVKLLASFLRKAI